MNRLCVSRESEGRGNRRTLGSMSQSLLVISDPSSSSASSRSVFDFRHPSWKRGFLHCYLQMHQQDSFRWRLFHSTHRCCALLTVSGACLASFICEAVVLGMTISLVEVQIAVINGFQIRPKQEIRKCFSSPPSSRLHLINRDIKNNS